MQRTPTPDQLIADEVAIEAAKKRLAAHVVTLLPQGKTHSQTEKCAAIFGITVDQARAAYARNLADLVKTEAQARKTGKKIRGYTADQLAINVARFKQFASESTKATK